MLLCYGLSVFLAYGFLLPIFREDGDYGDGWKITIILSLMGPIGLFIALICTLEEKQFSGFHLW